MIGLNETATEPIDARSDTNDWMTDATDSNGGQR